ncbi:MAG: ATP-binding protein [Fusobacterium sp.]|nr:ATP-binding protein [Fusobacterium sp.]
MTILKDKKNRIKICVQAYLENISIIRSMIRIYLKAHKVDETDEVQLLSIVDELATNAIEHGYSYDEKGEIKIVLNIFKRTIFLSVEDSGKVYDADIVNLDRKEDGGFGLFIVKKLVDVFKVEKKTKGTIFKIEKRLREAV